MMRSNKSEAVAAALILLAAGAAFAHPASAQESVRSSDVASPEAIVAATYESIARAPGENFDWKRFRSLFLPTALLIPSTEQRGGAFDILSVQEFIDWIDGATTIGGEQDSGFSEDGISNRIERYGDIAHVFSTYEKHFWGDDRNLGRGINTFQLVQNDGRWWIVSIAWDEEIGAGPIPEEYLP